MPDSPSDTGNLSGTSETKGESVANEQSPSLTENQLFTTLTNQRRRHIINYLRNNRDGAVGRRDLIDYILPQETESAPPDGRRETVAIDLHHCHLPMLAELGLIETGAENGAVRYRDHPVVEQLLTAVDGGTESPVGSSA